MDEYHGGKLIGEGSFGCVFHPAINCKNKKNVKDKVSKDKVSKVFFGDKSLKEAKQEIKHSDNIKKIKGYQDWSHIWDYSCKPPVYEDIVKVDKGIKECLYENDVSVQDFDKYSRMLKGDYGGNTLTSVITSLFTKQTFNSKKKFTDSFLKIMKLFKPLFIGLNEMYKHKISHNDIKGDNILVNKNTSKYIDFGLSAKYSDSSFFKHRSISEFLSDRIYIIYPYEFIFMFSTNNILQEELDDLKYDIYRSSHNYYKLIHEKIFKRNSTKKYLIESINIHLNKDIKNKSKINIISLLDTYSLGILLPYTLCKLSNKYNKITKLIKYIESEPISSFILLFKGMSSQSCENRIKPYQALKRYLELEQLYLKGSININIQNSVSESNRLVASEIQLKVKYKNNKQTLKKKRNQRNNRMRTKKRTKKRGRKPKKA